jgi:hypothetical protein
VADERSERRVLWSPEDCFRLRKRVKSMGNARTYVDITLYVTNENEVASTGVADVGVYGDGTPRVSLNRVSQLRDITRGCERAVSESSGLVGETKERGG